VLDWEHRIVVTVKDHRRDPQISQRVGTIDSEYLRTQLHMRAVRVLTACHPHRQSAAPLTLVELEPASALQTPLAEEAINLFL
jgi:hypothetical protein